jgi:hypothetical protein
MSKILCILRAGEGGIQKSWIPHVSRYVDVAISTFGTYQGDELNVPVRHHFNGSRMGGVHDFFLRNPGLIDTYTHFWLVEDDLYIPEIVALLIKSFAAVQEFELFAPTLSGDSYFGHAISVANRSFVFRLTNFVEQMSPVFSRRLLLKCLPHLNENYSGWGLEWLWHKYTRELGGFTAALDCAAIYHTRQGGSGQLYKNMPPGTPSPQEQLDTFMSRHGLQRSQFEFAAVKRGGSRRIVAGAEFFELSVRGYRYLAPMNVAAYKWCSTEALSSLQNADGNELAQARAFLSDVSKTKTFEDFMDLVDQVSS